MKSVLLVVIVSTIIISSVFATVDTSWVVRYNNPANDSDYIRAMVVDSAGNVYVTGSTKGAMLFDYLTIKYNTDGVEQWCKFRDNSNYNDYAYAITVDKAGNVYVTGTSYRNLSVYDFWTIKYDRYGNFVWEKTYDGPGGSNDEARAIAVDSLGNVYVTGYSVGFGAGANYDYATVKYDSSGVQQWVSRYNSPDDLDDRPTGLVLRSDTVYVTGYSNSLTTGFDYLTVKIFPNGDTAWTRRYGLAGPDYANAIAISTSGYVYVTGQYSVSTTSNINTVRYSPTGTQYVYNTYNGSGSSWDIGSAIAVDNAGYVYVTGYSMNTTSNYDYVTLKYSNSSTSILNTLRYDGSGDDRATDVVVNESGYIYVTGYSTGGTTGHDYATIKYRASNGQYMWMTRYDNAGGPDRAYAIAVDRNGNTYVAGESYTASTSLDYTTIKYGVVKDVGVAAITQPINTIDSTVSVTPRVSIVNYGSELESLNAIFRIGSWSNLVSISNLPPDSTRVIDFSPWTIGPRGSYATKCSIYNLIGDVIFTNDTASSAFSVRVHDVGTDLIVRPAGDIDSTALLIPQALVKNYGTTEETFNVKFTITNGNSNYVDDSVITLSAGNSLLVDFNPWSMVTDTFLAKCSTEFSNDIVQANNKQERIFRVIVHNVAASEIIAPIGNTDSVGTINPQARIVNQGTETETFNVWFFIPGSGYANMKTVTVGPGQNSVVIFDPWTVGPRGVYSVRCSTSLVNDMITDNDTLIRSFNIVIHNVGVTEIIQPSGTIDSIYQMAPRAKIKNFGSEQETLNVKFSILGPVNWNDNVMISLPGGTEQVVDFAPWTVRRGNYLVKCSTELNNDMIPSDDKISATCEIRVRDYAVSAITAPIGEIDSGATITPRAWICNYGTTDETNIPVVFYIENSAYSSIKYISLNACDSIEQNFDNFDVHLQRGIHVMRCSTQLTSDIRQDNNLATADLLIRFYDVGVTELVRPVGIVDSAVIINPQARVKNFGTRSETFNMTASIGIWANTQSIVNLSPGVETLIVFDAWPIGSRGNYAMRCSTYMSDDLNAINDTMAAAFSIIVRDFAVGSVYPIDTIIDYGMSITPQAWIHNYGSTDESDISVICYIPMTSYYSMREISLSAGDSLLQGFDDFVAQVDGNYYTIRCSTLLNGDVVEVNNAAVTGFLVIVPGWSIRETIPAFGGIKDGGALTTITDTIYALQGANTLNFFAYSILNNMWMSRCTIPLALKLDGIGYIKKRVKAGGSLTSHNGVVFAFKGNNTDEFWSYIPGGDSWIRKTSIPLYASSNLTKKRMVKSGASLVTVGNSIYAFKGGNCDQLWMYDVDADTWYEKRPLFAEGKKPKGGACLTAQGCTVYAFVGGSTYYFYQYLTETDTWIKMQDAKFGTNRTFKKKIKDGAGLCAVDDKIYALKGANTLDFGYYSVESDTWFTLDSIPGPIRVKAGGTLIAKDRILYAFKGGKSREFWRYTLPSIVLSQVEPAIRFNNSNVTGTNNQIVAANLVVTPNIISKSGVIHFTVKKPGYVRMSLYNPSGAIVTTICQGYYNTGDYTVTLNRLEFCQGVYFLRYEHDGKHWERKLIFK